MHHLVDAQPVFMNTQVNECMDFKVEIIFSLIHSQRFWQVFYIMVAMTGARREDVYERVSTNVLTIGKASQCIDPPDSDAVDTSPT